MSLSRNPKLIAIAKERCRDLRSRQTRAEALLWEAVRGRRFNGLKFYRQHPLFFDYLGKETFYIADFCCHERRVDVEIDGPVHERQKEKDTLREKMINALGYRVIRFKNWEIETNLSGVLDRLQQEIFGTHP